MVFYPTKKQINIIIIIISIIGVSGRPGIDGLIGKQIIKLLVFYLFTKFYDKN